MKIEYINIDEIKPYENNSKIHTEEHIDKIRKSIEEFGNNDPIAIWGKDNIIVEGHGRYEALKLMGKKDIPVIRLDTLSDEQRKAYTLVHNKLTLDTGFDFDVLNDELPHVHHGYLHNEYDGKKGATKLTTKEKEMVARIKKLWKIEASDSGIKVDYAVMYWETNCGDSSSSVDVRLKSI